MNNQSLLVLLNQKNRYETNHILHFILGLFTLSLWWVTLWPLVSLSNYLERNKIDKKIAKLGELT